ncbi:esterase/lipase [Planoprotostelium fungivorum]|uniref:Esterase/lipase n=1 Tax=Planoprotostelium fungivorum TaxID=1890364 RepID=A0A2P6N5G3_9EUKA|nr:esterase/lipase [Planoprotostelium fungivorum]
MPTKEDKLPRTGPGLAYRFWCPIFPSLESRLPWTGVVPWIYCSFHFIWTILTLPLQCILILLSYIPFIGCIFRGPVAIRPSWGIGQTLFLTAFQKFIWTWFWGLPTGNATPFILNGIPFTAKFFNCSGIFRSMGRSIFGMTKTGPDVLDFEEVLIDPAPSDWFYGPVTDPFGIVVPGPVACYWVTQADKERKVKRGSGKVLVYLVQGGFIRSNSLEAPFAYNICRETSTPLLTVEYRKAVDRSRCFPASIQDALAGYYYLLTLGYLPENILVMGDSAGGGLVHTLLLQLSTLRSQGIKSINDQFVQPPGRVLMLSPWVDLTMSMGDNTLHRYDIIYPPMEQQGASCYLAKPGVKYYKNREADQKARAANYPSVRAEQPLISPALRTPEVAAALDIIATAASECGGIKVMIMYGGTEVSGPEAKQLAANLRDAASRHSKLSRSPSIDVLLVEGKDGIHCYGSFYNAKSSEGVIFWNHIRSHLNQPLGSPSLLV